MMRLLAVSGTLLAAGITLPTVSRAGQEEGVWEFNLFGGKAKLDNADPFALVKTTFADFDGDASTAATKGTLARSVDLEDDNFIGFRLGFNWTKTIGSELVYDRNHLGADYHHAIDDQGTSVESVEGRVGAVFTSYQIGVLYHPLGKWKTPWQPYVTVAGGYIDVNLHPSSQLRSKVRGGLASKAFGVDFETGDNGVMVGYGAGLKFYVAENVAIRGEFRGKSYDLFDERRNDREVSLGISFFAPGSSD